MSDTQSMGDQGVLSQGLASELGIQIIALILRKQPN